MLVSLSVNVFSGGVVTRRTERHCDIFSSKPLPQSARGAGTICVSSFSTFSKCIAPTHRIVFLQSPRSKARYGGGRHGGNARDAARARGPRHCALCAYFTAAYGYQKEKLEDGRETLGSPFAAGAKVVIEEHEMPEMVQTMVRRSTPFSSSTL